MPRPLSRKFFSGDVVAVAQSLIGKKLVYYSQIFTITETEAYRNKDDPASHAYRGITPRNQLMFGEPGFAYVYLIYGMYHCLNVICEPKGTAAGVLIRGIKNNEKHLDGPGKICKYLGITREHHGLDLTKEKNFYLADSNLQLAYTKTSRIGIKQGQDKLWRFLAIE